MIRKHFLVLLTAVLVLSAVGVNSPTASAGFSTTPVVSGGPVGQAEAVPVLGAVAKVASGWNHRCAITTAGATWCWGANALGALGTGDFRAGIAARPVAHKGGFVDLASSLGTTCGLDGAGRVWCWGYNEKGTLGASGPASPTPIEVTLSKKVSKLWMGEHGACALAENDSVICWGDNAAGGLKPGGPAVLPPTTMTGVAGVKDMAIARTATCAVLSDDSVACWGTDVDGALGDGSGTAPPVTSADAVEPGSLAGVRDIAAGSTHFCAIKNGMFATSVWCWGTQIDVTTQAPTKVAGMATAVAIDAILDATCVATADHGATCWGRKSQIDGSKDFEAIPPTKVVDADVEAVSLGGSGICTVGASENVSCRGNNYKGAQSGQPGKPLAAGALVIAPKPAFTPVHPVRLVDTHANGSTTDGLLVGGGRIAAGSKISIQVAGRAGVPNGRRAVALQVRVDKASRAGELVVFPCSATAPRATTVTYPAGETRSAGTFVSLSKGRICLSSERRVHVIIDLVGRQAADDDLTTIRPRRLLDTRSTGTTVDGKDLGGGLTARWTPRKIQVLGRGGLPSTGVTSVVLSVTAGNGRRSGELLVSDCDKPGLDRSGHFPKSGATTFMVATSVDALGRVCLRTSSRTNVTVDVVALLGDHGSFDGGPGIRVADTRPGGLTDTLFSSNGQLEPGTFWGLPMTSNKTEEPLFSTPSTAVVMNVTVLDAESDGVVEVYDCGSPNTSAYSVSARAGVTSSGSFLIWPGQQDNLCYGATMKADVTIDVAARFNW